MSRAILVGGELGAPGVVLLDLLEGLAVGIGHRPVQHREANEVHHGKEEVGSPHRQPVQRVYVRLGGKGGVQVARRADHSSQNAPHLDWENLTREDPRGAPDAQLAGEQ